MPAELAEWVRAGRYSIEEAMRGGGPKFNRTNDNVGWANWTWNPVTGCLHNCDYCYARDIANRFYPQGFAPTFHPERLTAPQVTRVPKDAGDDPAWRRVFTCSMADLFGKWVPQEWIDAVFDAIVAAPQWEFLCLTKFPQRLAELDWPDNAWVGTTVDKQHRVALAERSFAGVTAGVKWLSCEPLLEPLKFSSLEMFDWVVIGACSASSGAPAFAPPWDWVVDLYRQARDAGCKVYLKHNLETGPGMGMVREWPTPRAGRGRGEPPAIEGQLTIDDDETSR
jgi:protein gp37